MDMLNCNDHRFYIEMVEYLEDSLRDLNLYYLVSVLRVYVLRQIEMGDFDIKVFDTIMFYGEYLNLLEYKDTWALLARHNAVLAQKQKLKEAENNIEDPDEAPEINFPTKRYQRRLIEVFEISEMLKVKKFNVEEIGSILISLAALRVKNWEFVGDFVKKAATQISSSKIDVSTEQLVFLGQGMYAYSKSFEDPFVRFHNVCVDRFGEFKPEQLEVLAKVFKLRADVLPRRSPFLNLKI